MKHLPWSTIRTYATLAALLGTISFQAACTTIQTT